MRWQLKVMIAVLMGFGALELATNTGLTQIGGGGFGGGFGGFGGGKATSDPFTLLRNNSVKKEIKFTDEQLAKLDAAMWKAVAEILDGDQLKRLKQIDLQQRDYRAFTDPSVQTSLKMSDKQKDEIKTILSDAEKELADLTKDLKAGGGGGDFKGMFEKMQSIGKETKERCTGVLTADQKRLWGELVGEEFKMEKGGGFGKKKKDTN